MIVRAAHPVREYFVTHLQHATTGRVASITCPTLTQTTMRLLVGLFWALGGGVAGLLVGGIAGTIITKMAHVSEREGAAGYSIILIALVGAVLGMVAGILLYGRSAPSGQAVQYSASSVLGVVALVAAIAFGVWAFLNLRETSATYDGAMADLLLEVRTTTTDLPPTGGNDWFTVEVQTPKTRPEGSIAWSEARTEGIFRIFPVTQGQLSRTTSRSIVIHVANRQDEIFSPPMKRLPDPKADWSEWYKPNSVEPAYGVTPTAPCMHCSSCGTAFGCMGSSASTKRNFPTGAPVDNVELQIARATTTAAS
jgi:hypothetical protein